MARTPGEGKDKKSTTMKTKAPGLMALERRLMLDASVPVTAGLVLWLDAADATTIVDGDGDNASTGTGGANNGFSGTVATWVDKSASGYNVTNATAGQRPQYGVNTRNGHNVLTFDGTDDKLTNLTATVPGDDITMFVVFNRTTGTARDAIMEVGSGGNRNAIFHNESGDNRINYYINGTMRPTTVYTANTYTMVDVVQNNTNITVDRDGSLITTTTGANRTGTTGLFIGDDSSGGDNMQGHIAEVIVFDRDLSADERNDVQNYLATKWGFTITNTAPVVATNAGAALDQADTITVSAAMLAATDADNSEAILRYTITDASDYGTLTNTNTGLALTLGDTFTQADIDAGYITYTHDGTANFADAFSFTVSDGYASTAAATFNFTMTPLNNAPEIQGWTQVSHEDFQAGATGWSNNLTTNGGAYFTTFLGRHAGTGGAQGLEKTYTLSGTQDYAVFTFDVYEIDSWDGESFRIFIDDTQVFLTNFSAGTFNAPADGSFGAVSWTVQEFTPFNVNFALGGWAEQIYRFTMTVNTNGASVKLGFGSTLDQGITDEAWGIDNITLYEVADGGVPAFSIVENAANGTHVGTVTASDPDAGDVLTYSITGGTGAGVFAINAATGAITVTNAAAMDYETNPTYTLTVRVTDDGTPSYFDEETITINLLDMPENTAPSIAALGPFTLAENAAVNTVLGTASATDAQGNAITWSITGGNTDNLFAINSTTGQIRLSSVTALNYEWDNSYTLTIQAQDNGFGNLTSTRNVTINISNINEAPTFNIPQSFLNENPYLRYNAATGNFYQYVSTAANYATATANAAAAMLNGVAGHLATITSAAENTYVRGLGSAAIWLGGSDATTEGTWVWAGSGAEGGATFSLGAVAQGGYYTNWQAGQPDDGGNSDGLEMLAGGQWTDITVGSTRAYVIEWEGAAVMAALGNGPFTLAENPALNQSVGFVHARDADAGDTLSYSITGGTGAAHFAVNATTGEITVTNPAAINFESATSFTLDMQVQDALGLTGTQTVTINITNVNEAPVITTPAGPFSVAENAAVNTIVGDINATDVDAGSVLTYSIVGGNADGIFAINGTTGEIRIANTTHLNYEAGTTYNLSVRVTDNGTGSLTDTEVVTINITDVNEAPSFDEVQQVLNANPHLRYSSATGNFYRYVTTAANQATAISNAAAMIVGGQAGYLVAINSAAENTFVRGLITATSWINGSDGAVEGEWRYVGGPNDGEMFWLGNGAGSAQNGHYENWGGSEPNNSGNEDAVEMNTGGAWNDINAANSRTYVVEWDGAGLIAAYNNGPYSIAENPAMGQSIGFVHANDPDAGHTVAYSVTGGSGAAYIAVDSVTGEMTVTDPSAFNFENITSFTLDLRADAGGLFATRTVTINITNVNEAPVINELGPYSIDENVTAGTVVGATGGGDVDAGTTLTYTIQSGNTDGIFAINAATGQITVGNAINLNYEHQNIYNLVIRVTDNGTPTLFDEHTYTININDVNEAPSFRPIQAILNSDPTLRYNAATDSFYKYVSAPADYATAQGNAAAMLLNGVGGYLTNITSAQENAFVTSMIGASSWIGGSDAAVEGEWRFTHGAEAGDMFWLGAAGGSAQNGYYNNFGGGEPNNSGDEDAIELRTTGIWNDEKVGGARTYVVEWSAQDVIASMMTLSYDVPEHSQAGVFSPGSTVAYDPDNGETLTYSITGGSGLGIFSINAATGAITLASNVNYEVIGHYTLDLRVQDSGGLFDTLTVDINIIDENDVPGSLNLAGNFVMENSGVGTLIGDLTTFDEDPAHTVHIYSLVSNPGGKFTIVGNQLFTAGGIDYELNRNFSIIIRTDDGHGGTLDRAFTINVGDEMDTFTPPPETGGPDVGAGPDTRPNEEDEGGPRNLIAAAGMGEAGQADAFYGLSGFRQILRENITFEILGMRDGAGEGAEEILVTTEEVGVEQVSEPGAQEPAQARYTNIREALEFLQNMASDDKGAPEPDANPQREAALPPINRQFVDVMTYHEERAAKLRSALLDS